MNEATTKMNCVYKVTSSLQVLILVFFLELIILHWCHALGENTESGIWKSFDKNSEAVKDYEMMASTNIDTNNEEGNFEDQDVNNDADLFDDYRESMMYGDIKKHNTPFKRGIKKQREEGKRRKLLKHENANLNVRESGDSLIGTIIDNPDRIQGPLKDLISKYSEAHKHMNNKFHRNGFKSLKADMKTTNKGNENKSKEKFLIKQNKHGDKQNVVTNDDYLSKASGLDALSSVPKSNEDEKKDEANKITFQSTSNNGKETKDKPKSLDVHNDEEIKDNVRKLKKNHKIKDTPEDKLGGYVGEDNSGEKPFREDIRRNYINRLIKINPIGEYNRNNSENELYANMSLINKGFLEAVEKKYFSMDNGALTKFKPKPSLDFGLNINKPENTDSHKNNWILNKNENEVIERIQSSLKSNGMPNNKNLSDGKVYNDNPKLDTGTYDNEASKNTIVNKSLEQGRPIKSAILSKSAGTENNQNADRHHNHGTEMKNGLYELEYKDSLQTTTQRVDEKQTRKVKLQDVLHPKKASHILSKNDVNKKNVFLNNNEKRDKKRLHRKIASEYSLKESDSLGSGIKDTIRTEVKSKKNHLSRTKDHAKRRNERDVEHKNPKLRKYRIGVDSRGRSRLMINDIDDYNNSGSFNEESENNEKGSNKRNLIGPNSLKHYQPQYAKESNEDPLDEEVNDIQDNVGDDAYNDEGNDNDDDTDEDADVKKVFARRAHHPKYNDDEPSVTDSCVEYKGEKITSKTSRSTDLCPTTTEKTETQSSTTKRKNKEKTTPKANGKTQMSKSKSAYTESIDNSTSYKDLDDYEQFLTGLFADNFVNAVLTKVQRSRKMAKELGFSNDTDDSCDRCLETKLHKMPDLEVLRKSLKNLPKSSQKKNSQLCHRVPEPMDDFLLLLISYEKGQESSVYKNIQDESSFIFTGDYPESSVREDRISGNEKYNGEKESIGKDAFEKQHLREEGNEDKNDDQMMSRNNGPLSHTLRPSNNLQEEESTDQIINQNDDSTFNGQTKKRKGKKVERKNEMHSSTQEENLNVDVFDSHDARPSRSRYNHYTDPENVFDTSNAKHRRQSYKNENVPSLPRSDMKSGLDIKGYQHWTDTGKINRFPNLNYRIPNNERDFGHNVQSNGYDYPISHKEKHNLAKNDVIPSNTNTRDNHYAKPNKFYEYPQEGWAEKEEAKMSKNKDSQYLISDDVLSNGEEEYALYPNLNGDDTLLNPMSDYRYRKTDYSGNSRMVKRNTETSYDDDPIFFEVPDIEYDLY